MKGAGRIFQRQYEKGGEREHKLTLNLLLPHLSVNFTLLPFFVQTFQCDSIDCPLLLHKRIQSCLWECVWWWGEGGWGGGVVSSRVKLSHMPSCSFLNIKTGQSGLGELGAVPLIGLMSIFLYFLILVKLCSIFMLIMWPILRVIRWVRHSEGLHTSD